MRAFGNRFRGTDCRSGSARRNFNANRLLIRSTVEWTAIGDWALSDTPETVMFLRPPRPDRDSPAETLAEVIAPSRAAVFGRSSPDLDRLQARRRRHVVAALRPYLADALGRAGFAEVVRSAADLCQTARHRLCDRVLRDGAGHDPAPCSELRGHVSCLLNRWQPTRCSNTAGWTPPCYRGTVTTRRLLVVPACANGMPATTTRRSVGLAKSCSTAKWVARSTISS